MRLLGIHHVRTDIGARDQYLLSYLMSENDGFDVFKMTRKKIRLVASKKVNPLLR